MNTKNNKNQRKKIENKIKMRIKKEKKIIEKTTYKK